MKILLIIFASLFLIYSSIQYENKVFAIHFVDEGADTGPIILQKKCVIESDETVDSLKEKVQKLEGKGFIWQFQ